MMAFPDPPIEDAALLEARARVLNGALVPTLGMLAAAMVLFAVWYGRDDVRLDAADWSCTARHAVRRVTPSLQGDAVVTEFDCDQWSRR